MIQNITQFNGEFGCSWCETPGQRIPSGATGNTVNVYPYKRSLPLRTKETFARYADMAKVSEVVCMGVKGEAILSSVPTLDIAFGIVFDSMHCMDLGVDRQLGTLWFDSSYHKEPWYIGTKEFLSRIDQALSLIQPPSNITRLSRPTSTRPHWKASEWRNFF